jgi:1-acyl-sn-glycerol-3-phosphate acyltransferase
MPDRRGPFAWLGLTLLRLAGWRVAGGPPDLAKYVLVGAPHTSAWDFPLMLAFGLVWGVKFQWLGKTSLFRPPLGALFRALGGIPVERSASQQQVQLVVQQFRERERMALAISPEGTRRQSGHWRTGFYYIAHGAGVPIALGFLDYGRKVGGIGPTIVPTGSIERDLPAIAAFYADIRGKHPEKASAVTLAPGKE